MRCNDMWEAYRGDSYEMYVDREDPEYTNMQVRYFYRHHPR